LKYDFNRVVNRYDTASVKWDEVEKRFGEKDLLPMWVADMDFMVPPPVLDAIKRRAEHGIMGYTSQPESYFDAVMDWMEKRHKWTIKKEWIYFSPGVVPGLNMIIQAFTSPGDKILIQPPVYYPFAGSIINNGRQLVYNQLLFEDGLYKIDFNDLFKKLAGKDVKLLILCSPHNPVGRVWSKEELAELGDMCLDCQTLVVSDEIHCDITYENYVHIPFCAVSDEFGKNSITCTAPSKTFNMPGLQTANLIIPNPAIAETYARYMKKLGLLRPNVFGILLTESAYRCGSKWLDQLLEYLQQNLVFLTGYIRDRIPQIKVVKPEGTYLVWLDCRDLGLGVKQLEQFMLKQAKVALDDGYIFGPGGEGFTRINIACPRSTLEEGLRRIETAVKKLSVMNDS